MSSVDLSSNLDDQDLSNSQANYCGPTDESKRHTFPQYFGGLKLLRENDVEVGEDHYQKGIPGRGVYHTSPDPTSRS
jgi:hypothetical protein